MGKIALLDKNTIDKIAAGEVGLSVLRIMGPVLRQMM